MSIATTNWVYTAEQKEQWDKQLGTSGYHQVVGDQAFTYLCQVVKRMVDSVADPKTVLLVGSAHRCERLLQLDGCRRCH